MQSICNHLRSFQVPSEQKEMMFRIRVPIRNRFVYVPFLRRPRNRCLNSILSFQSTRSEKFAVFFGSRIRENVAFIYTRWNATSAFHNSSCRSMNHEMESNIKAMSTQSASDLLPNSKPNSIDGVTPTDDKIENAIKGEKLRIKNRNEESIPSTLSNEIDTGENEEIDGKNKVDAENLMNLKNLRKIKIDSDEVMEDSSIGFDEALGDEENGGVERGGGDGNKSLGEIEEEEEEEEEEDSDEEDYYQTGDATTGIRLSKTETNREAVLSFLAAEGIDVELFDGIPLPNDVDVVSERLEFLCSLGIEVAPVINKFPPLLCCSISRNFIPVLNYLETIPVRRSQLVEIISKYPRMLYASVVVDLVPIVDYLLGIGVAKNNLGELICRFPQVFGFKLEGTMSTSVAYIVGLGVNLRSVGDIITAEPEILGMRVGTTLLPKVQFLEKFGIPKERIAKIIESRPFVLKFDLDNQMKASVDSLLKAGVQEEDISKVIISYPEVLGLTIPDLLPPVNQWLKKEIGVNDEDLPKILSSIPQVLSIDFERANRKLAFFRGAGFSRVELAEMIKKCPRILGLSLKKSLKPKLDFLVKQMKRPLTELVEYPQYFMYSLDLIAKRHSRLLAEEIECSLQWMLDCDDLKFVDRFDLDVLDGPLDPLIIKPMSDSNDW